MKKKIVLLIIISIVIFLFIWFFTRKIDKSHDGIIYSDEGVIEEAVIVKITGTLHNKLFGKKHFTGKLIFDGEEEINSLKFDFEIKIQFHKAPSGYAGLILAKNPPTRRGLAGSYGLIHMDGMVDELIIQLTEQLEGHEDTQFWLSAPATNKIEAVDLRERFLRPYRE